MNEQELGLRAVKNLGRGFGAAGRFFRRVVFHTTGTLYLFAFVRDARAAAGFERLVLQQADRHAGTADDKDTTDDEEKDDKAHAGNVGAPEKTVK